MLSRLRSFQNQPLVVAHESRVTFDSRVRAISESYLNRVVAHESRVMFDSRVRAISESYLNRGASSQDTSEPLLTILSIEDCIENYSQDPSEPLLTILSIEDCTEEPFPRPV